MTEIKLSDGRTVCINEHKHVVITGSNGGSISSQRAGDILLFEILLALKGEADTGEG